MLFILWVQNYHICYINLIIIFLFIINLLGSSAWGLEGWGGVVWQGVCLWKTLVINVKLSDQPSVVSRLEPVTLGRAHPHPQPRWPQFPPGDLIWDDWNSPENGWQDVLWGCQERGWCLWCQWASLVAQTVKNLFAIQDGAGFDPWVRKILWRRE